MAIPVSALLVDIDSNAIIDKINNTAYVIHAPYQTQAFFQFHDCFPYVAADDKIQQYLMCMMSAADPVKRNSVDTHCTFWLNILHLFQISTLT